MTQPSSGWLQMQPALLMFNQVERFNQTYSWMVCGYLLLLLPEILLTRSEWYTFLDWGISLLSIE